MKIDITQRPKVARPSKPSKLFGAYPQKQEGLYMQRIPIFAGHLTARQLKEIARISREFTNSAPLHLTTRQDIELHQIPEKDLDSVQKKLNDIGLSTYGAGGDSVRNITVCPCCRFNSAAYDVQPLAAFLKEALLESPLLEKMPRKFKISFSGCGDPQSKPYVNDLSFLATTATTVRVIGAGSLGAHPETGIVLFDQLAAGDVIPLTLAAVKLFVEHGERANRRKARLRHVRQKLGDNRFLELLKVYFQRGKEHALSPMIPLRRGMEGWSKMATIQTVAGQLEVNDALLLAETLEQNKADFRVNLHHGLDIYAQNKFELPAELNAYLNRPVIVACPGSTTCKNGLINCPKTAAELSEVFKDTNAIKDRIIALSGCPNNCAHSSVADLGLSGLIRTVDGRRQEVYKIFANGGNGNTPELAEQKQLSTRENLVKQMQHILKEELERD